MLADVTPPSEHTEDHFPECPSLAQSIRASPHLPSLPFPVEGQLYLLQVGISSLCTQVFGCVKSWKKESKQHLACSTTQGKIKSSCLEADKGQLESLLPVLGGCMVSERIVGLRESHLSNPLQSHDLRSPFNFLGAHPPLLPSLWPMAQNLS